MSGEMERADASAIEGRDAWRSIDTAPKDGTCILLGCANSDDTVAVSTMGWWQESESDGPDTMGADAGFVDYAFNCFCPSRSFGNPDFRRPGYQPTHWQPLPNPPTLVGEARPRSARKEMER